MSSCEWAGSMVYLLLDFFFGKAPLAPSGRPKFFNWAQPYWTLVYLILAQCQLCEENVILNAELNSYLWSTRVQFQKRSSARVNKKSW